MSSTDTVAKTTPLAMHAVARHMLDNGLPAPTDLSAPRACLGESSLRVEVWSGDAEAWVDSIHVDDATTAPTAHPEVPAGVYERAIWHGRLPDSGVRVSIVTIRRIAAGAGRRVLTTVPA